MGKDSFAEYSIDLESNYCNRFPYRSKRRQVSMYNRNLSMDIREQSLREAEKPKRFMGDFC
jgi:hypothetical protein